MDVFDEFEFKPLTNGLGFHKKAATLKEQLKKSGALESEMVGMPKGLPANLLDDAAGPIKNSIPDIGSGLEKNPYKLKKQPIHDLDFTETLPREPKKSAMDVEMPRPIQSPFPKPEAFRQPFIPATPGAPSIPAVPPAPAVDSRVEEAKKLLRHQELSNVGTRRGAADSPQGLLIAASTSVPSAILDFVVVVALTLIFMVALMLVTGVDLGLVMTNIGDDLLTQISGLALFMSVMQMYVIISRSFYGCTLGEWTFDHQLGQSQDQERSSYPLRVALRSFVIILSGVILLPILSLLIGRDLAGRLSGTQLYRQRI